MRNLLSCMLLLCLTACGYNFAGQGELPGGAKTIFVPLFKNQTAEPLLENNLSNAVSVVFARNNRMSLIADRQAADAVFEGVVKSFSSRALAYDQNDDISEYRATIQVEARLLQEDDGRLLWQGTVAWSEAYDAATNKNLQEVLKQEAIDEISQRLAEELLYRLIDNF